MQKPLQRSWFPLLLAAWALAGQRPMVAATITNSQFDFTLAVPDRYIQIPAGGDAIYNFATSDPAKGIPDAAIAVQRLHGTIGREHLELQSTGLPDAKLLSGQWKTFPVDVITAHLSANGVKMSLRGAQIPLRHEAVQVLVLVPVEKEGTAEAILNEFLAGLDGPSNWSSPAPDAPGDADPMTPEKRGELFGKGLAQLLVVTVLVIIGVAALVRRLRRNKTGS